MQQMGLFHDPPNVLWNGGGPVPPRNVVSPADGFNKGPFQSVTGCSHLGITKRARAGVLHWLLLSKKSIDCT